MIHFVGAGPGDKELVTVKGQRLLAEADCVIYAGSLVNPALLEYARPGVEVHDSAGMTLEQVIEVMQGCEAAGLDTVRLHTGDPSIYGAIREQIDILEELGIAYEVVPGVSAFSGAAAALGAEYTLPGVSQTVILSRMEGRTAVPAGEGIESLAAHQASMALFLSAGMLEELARRLQAGGYAPDTPAALVYKATWPDQRVVRTTLAELAREGAEQGIDHMAMVLVGGFLGDAYQRSELYNPSFSHGFRAASES